MFSGSDNIRDAWSPYGDGDMVARAMMIGYRQGLLDDADVALAFELGNARTILISQRHDLFRVISADEGQASGPPR